MRAIEYRATMWVQYRDMQAGLEAAQTAEKLAAEAHYTAHAAENEARTALDTALYEEARA